MTTIDQQRLAALRMQSERWIAVNPEAKTWDTAFLLAIIDRQSELIRKMRKAGGKP